MWFQTGLSVCQSDRKEFRLLAKTVNIFFEMYYINNQNIVKCIVQQLPHADVITDMQTGQIKCDIYALLNFGIIY